MLYPKVLLLGHQFDNRTGLGVTLSNLFANWPKENLAILAHYINVDLCDSARPCAIYIGQKVISNKASFQLNNTKVRDIIRRVFNYFGGQEIRYKYAFRDSDIHQVSTFNPDIIFSCLGSLNSMKDCINVTERFPSAKLVLYIVDDWVNTKENNRFLPSYWREKNNMLFKLLLERASGLLSICPYMSEVYGNKYGKTFIPFHNPVDLDKWTSHAFARRYPEHIKAILYVGKINDDTRDCLLDTATVVEGINKSNKSKSKYIFDIYTPNYSDSKDLFKSHHNCHIYPPVPHSDIIKITKSYDALLLTLGFSSKTRSYVRLSMPTKLSEYLAAGIPSILYCPDEIALARYLVPHNCTINCLQQDNKKLKESILLLDNESFCYTIVGNALTLAAQHDVLLVRQRFENALFSFIQV